MMRDPEEDDLLDDERSSEVVKHAPPQKRAATGGFVFNGTVQQLFIMSNVADMLAVMKK